MNTKLLKATVAAGATVAVGGLVTGGAQAAPEYPLPPTTTISAQAPIPPPVTLPQTGGDGVNDMLLIGTTIAVAGGGLLIVSRRRAQRSNTA